MNPYSIPPLLAGGLALVLGVFVMANNRRDRLNRLFFGICVAIFVWLGCFAAAYSMSNARLALFLFRFAYTGVCFIPILSLNFHLEFIGIHKPKLMVTLYLVSSVFFFISYTPWFFSSVKRFFWGFYPQAGSAYPLFIVYFATLLFASSGILSYQVMRGLIRGEQGNFKSQQLRFLGLAFIIAYGGCVDFIAKFGIPIYPFGYANIVLFVIILSYAMLRHRLLDVETMMQIFQQNKLATLGLLSAGLNHEIKNPLYVIRGYAESFLENLRSGVFKDPGEAVRSSEQIFSRTIQQVERTVAIMKRFSGFARVSRDGIQREVIEVEECVRNVLEFLGHQLAIRKVKIETYFGEGTRIHGNKREVEEIVFNIVINAVEAMQEEGGRLEINAIRRGEECLIFIRDSGPGIPKHLQKKIFEPFYSGKREGGTGLGLFICQFLTEQNGGRIHLDSKLGEGTVFVLAFPAANQVREEVLMADTI